LAGGIWEVTGRRGEGESWMRKVEEERGGGKEEKGGKERGENEGRGEF